jgi:hypothetical protein
MKKTGRIILICGLTPLLCGCDPILGVSRGAIVTTMPDLTCIKGSIETTSGISGVTYTKTGGGKDLVGTPISVEHHYVYKASGSDVSNLFTVTELPRGEIGLSDSHQQVGVPPPQPEVDLARPLMSEVEANIARHCGMADLPKIMEESCNGVKCG